MKTFKGKNISIEWRFNFDQKVKNNFSNRQFATLLEDIINRNVLRKIDKGLSPVDGVRMFKKYKDPKSYPGDLKQSNKPNLTLTGNMLSNYVAKQGEEQMTATMGIHSDAPEIEKVKAVAHNYGTQGNTTNAALKKKNIFKNTKNKSLRRAAKKAVADAQKGIPARPFVPKKGEIFTRDIMLEIRKAFAYCLNQAINRGKNK